MAARVKDLTGQRFGRLVVLRRGLGKPGRVFWDCQCDCSRTITVYAGSLLQGGTRSCGCLQKEARTARGTKPIHDLTGQRFSRLLVVERSLETQTALKSASVVWRCLCDCGKERMVSGSCLVSGHTRSCGCLRKDRKYWALPKGEAALNDLMSRYKRHARLTGRTFFLDLDGFRSLVTSRCHYCGIEPSQVIQARYGLNGGIRYNGVDRVDSTKGYEVGNVVSCCGQCNRAKSDLTIDEFRAWVDRLTFWHRV